MDVTATDYDTQSTSIPTDTQQPKDSSRDSQPSMSHHQQGTTQSLISISEHEITRFGVNGNNKVRRNTIPLLPTIVSNQCNSTDVISDLQLNTGIKSNKMYLVQMYSNKSEKEQKSLNTQKHFL